MKEFFLPDGALDVSRIEGTFEGPIPAFLRTLKS